MPLSKATTYCDLSFLKLYYNIDLKYFPKMFNNLKTIVCSSPGALAKHDLLYCLPYPSSNENGIQGKPCAINTSKYYRGMLFSEGWSESWSVVSHGEALEQTLWGWEMRGLQSAVTKDKWLHRECEGFLTRSVAWEVVPGICLPWNHSHHKCYFCGECTDTQAGGNATGSPFQFI